MGGFFQQGYVRRLELFRFFDLGIHALIFGD